MKAIVFPVRSSGFAGQACSVCRWAKPTVFALATRFLPGDPRPRLRLARSLRAEFWTAISNQWTIWALAGLPIPGIWITPRLRLWTVFPSASQSDAAYAQSTDLFPADAGSALGFLAAAASARAR